MEPHAYLRNFLSLRRPILYTGWQCDILALDDKLSRKWEWSRSREIFKFWEISHVSEMSDSDAVDMFLDVGEDVDHLTVAGADAMTALRTVVTDVRPCVV